MKMLRVFLAFAVFTVILLSCETSFDRPKDNIEERIKSAIIELDSYYRASSTQSESLEQRNKKVQAISQKFSIKIMPLTQMEFESYNQDQLFSNERAQCTCCGTILHVELVDEGNGCYGLVRQYENGSSSITAMCYNDSGALAYEGTYCFE